jgi:glucose uptake protein GlcU
MRAGYGLSWHMPETAGVQCTAFGAEGLNETNKIQKNITMFTLGFSWDQINIHQVHNFFRSRDSVVGIATSYGLDDLGVGVRVPVGSRIFCSPNRPDWL